MSKKVNQTQDTPTIDAEFRDWCTAVAGGWMEFSADTLPQQDAEITVWDAALEHNAYLRYDADLWPLERLLQQRYTHWMPAPPRPRGNAKPPTRE